MADIIVTMSRDVSAHPGSIAKEANWLEDEGELFWPLRGQPSRSIAGGFIYFIEDGSIAGRAHIRTVGIRAGTSYTGKKHFPPSLSAVYVSPMQFPRDKYIKHKGFQGFSYVDKDLQRSPAKARWTQGQRVSNLIGVLDTDPSFVEGRPGFRKHLIKETKSHPNRPIQAVGAGTEGETPMRSLQL